MVKNIGDIWQRDDLSTGEKWLETITGASSALLILLPMLTTMSTALHGLTVAQMAHGAVSLSGAAADKLLA
jgi:hypothetical protein